MRGPLVGLSDWPIQFKPRAIWQAVIRLRPIKPSNYHYLSYSGWALREIALFGCRSRLFHLTYGGQWGCWCDFWDAQ